MSRPFSENRMSRTIHDPSKYWETKMAKSSNYFKQTRVQTCSHVLYKNGKAIAVAFPLEKKGLKNTNRLTETKSIAQSTYGRRGNLHAGMPVKPLEPYHPNAHRSRLPTPTVVMPYRNASSIVIGDRSSDYKRQFTSHNRVTYPRHRLDDATTNGGILATKTKWFHRRKED
ncbi:unnamed protein product [Moneuplotes crassus]|uniref:Uncharacterized protein n=1 Tax=Euplotes crassus TaxID=5936 RepID=A0AAD2D5N5_EUPCR|nr:unnamed protein product [Moneuplotes crassus]